MTRDISLTDHNSTVATPAAGALRTRTRRRRSAVGPIKTVSILGLVGAFVAAIALPAFAGSAAPAAPVIAAVETGPEEQPQELVVASTVTDKESDRNSLSATSATEIAEQKAAEEAERQRQLELERLAALQATAGTLASASGYTGEMLSIPAGSGAVVWPLIDGTWYTDGADSHYGWRWGRMHEGHDFTAPGGTPIYAMADGVVTTASYSGNYGNLVTIEHSIGGQRVESRYAHQQHGCIAVSVGEYVSAGQYIGCVGTTGNSYGNHLHLEIRVNGSTVNPLNWLYNYAG